AGQPVPAAARCGGCACGDDDPRRRPGRPGPPGQPAPVLGPQPLNAGARPLAGNGPGGRLRAPRITTFKEPTWAGATRRPPRESVTPAATARFVRGPR